MKTEEFDYIKDVAHILNLVQQLNAPDREINPLRVATQPFKDYLTELTLR